MSTTLPPRRTTRRRTSKNPSDLYRRLSDRVIGQDKALREIVPFVQMYQAGLAPAGRPAGVFLLLGPTGTGKTKTVEALAEVIHGSPKHVLKIDCGEFQMEHEVAKLIGAPPGYLGHRETHPILTQARLASVTSDRSAMSLVLFDEIEKAATSLNQLLLGVLDKGLLRLGDNTTVNFENSMVFLTSNLGARGIADAMGPRFGLGADARAEDAVSEKKLDAIARNAVRKHFSPEFVNRIDAIISYQPLSVDSLKAILRIQLMELQEHIINRLGPRAFRLLVTQDCCDFLLEAGSSKEFGAREMKRALLRQIMHPLATMVMDGEISPGGAVRIDVDEDEDSLTMRAA